MAGQRLGGKRNHQRNQLKLTMDPSLSGYPFIWRGDNPVGLYGTWWQAILPQSMLILTLPSHLRLGLQTGIPTSISYQLQNKPSCYTNNTALCEKDRWWRTTRILKIPRTETKIYRTKKILKWRLLVLFALYTCASTSMDPCIFFRTANERTSKFVVFPWKWRRLHLWTFAF